MWRSIFIYPSSQVNLMVKEICWIIKKYFFTQNTGSTPSCSNNNIYISDNHSPCAVLPSAALFSVPSYFLALLLTKRCWRYVDPFILLHLMLYNLCTRAQEIFYLSSAVFKWELLSLAGKLQRQMCQNLCCTAHREGCAHPWESFREDGCRHQTNTKRCPW